MSPILLLLTENSDKMIEYIKSAREFAKISLNSNVSAVVIQNAHKAVEFALSVYAVKSRAAMPRDHWQSKNLAYRINKDFGKKFGTLLRMYLGAYRLENGEKAKKAKKLMTELLKEIEKLVGETFLP